MAQNIFNANSNLDIGIGLRAQHFNHIIKERPVCGWFEIISENYLIDGGRQLEILDEILSHYTVVMHGVSQYFGSPDKPNREHLKRLKSLVKRTNTPWMTDHLCWGSIDGTYTHDLLPLIYTKEAVRVASEKIRYVRDTLEIPISVENLSSYCQFEDSTMSEWEFLTEVVEQADCGILLDVNNIYVSSVNHSFDPKKYIDSIPLDRVAQIHIAGHSKYQRYIIDTHDSRPIDPVWQLYEYVIKKIGNTPTLLEWDSKIPSYDEVYSEAFKAKNFWNRD